MPRTERPPRANDVEIAVLVPASDGSTLDVEMGKASLKAGTLVVEFNNKLPAVAIQRMLERGVPFALTFHDLRERPEPTQAERDAADLALLGSTAEVEYDGPTWPEGHDNDSIPYDGPTDAELEAYVDEEHKTNEENN